MAKLMILLVLLALVGAQAGEREGSPNKKAKTPGNKKLIKRAKCLRKKPLFWRVFMMRAGAWKG